MIWYASTPAAVTNPGWAVRGSLGFGEDSVQALPGRISLLDVEDCLAALDTAIAQGSSAAWKTRNLRVPGLKSGLCTLEAAAGAGVVDPDRVAVMGGSHGGFLTGHLLGQHPTRFRTGILRNPVLCLMQAWPKGLSRRPRSL